MLLEMGVASAAGLVGGAWLVRRSRVPLQPQQQRSYSLGVVVTGSTRGLGLAMAEEFVRHGDSVVVSGRHAASVDAARHSLLPLATAEGQQVVGCVCDVSSASACTELARTAQASLGRVDLWVNNAGTTQHPKQPLASTPASVVEEVVTTNLLGTIFGCRAAINVRETALSPTAGCARA